MLSLIKNKESTVHLICQTLLQYEYVCMHICNGCSVCAYLSHLPEFSIGAPVHEERSSNEHIHITDRQMKHKIRTPDYLLFDYINLIFIHLHFIFITKTQCIHIILRAKRLSSFTSLCDLFDTKKSACREDRDGTRTGEKAV